MKRFTGNPFANPAIVSSYESWYETTGRRADRLEKPLLERLLAKFSRVDTILEVGCGTGHFTRWFGEQGLRAVGLDLSLPMLAEAVRLGTPRCLRGDALALPFCSGAFDLVFAHMAIVATLVRSGRVTNGAVQLVQVDVMLLDLALSFCHLGMAIQAIGSHRPVLAMSMVGAVAVVVAHLVAVETGHALLQGVHSSVTPSFLPLYLLDTRAL